MSKPVFLNYIAEKFDELPCRISNCKMDLLTALGKLLLPQGYWGHPVQAGAEPTIFLTFDDGPDPETTPRLLALCEAQSIKASFFLKGENCARYPDLVRSIHDQ